MEVFNSKYPSTEDLRSLASKKIPVKKFYNEATQLAQIGINEGVDSDAFKNFKTDKVIKN